LSKSKIFSKRSITIGLGISLILSLTTSPIVASAAPGAPETKISRTKIMFPTNGRAPFGLPVETQNRTNLNFPASGRQPSLPSYGINFHGGTVMANGVNVYLIWYGDWSSNPTAKPILENFVRNLNGSSYNNINATYTDATGKPLSNRVTLSASYQVPGTPQGTALSDADVLTIIQNSIGPGKASATVDTDGLYLLLTAAGITETSGFMTGPTAYCGWHDSLAQLVPGTLSAANIKYGFIGNPGGQSTCMQQVSSSPNNNPDADAMASIIAHEIVETITDPDGTGWWVSSGRNTGWENGDLCAWNFGTQQSVSSSSIISSTVVSATNNSIQASFKVTAASNNSTSRNAGNQITYTAVNSLSAGQVVTISGLINPTYNLANVAVASSTGSQFTVNKSVPANTPAAPNQLAASAVVSKASTSTTYTTSTPHTFKVGDNVALTISGPNSAYSLTNSGILSVTPTSFTVSSSLVAGTPAIGSLSIVAQATRTTVSYFNLTLNGAKYLIQRNWANKGPSGSCQISNP